MTTLVDIMCYSYGMYVLRIIFAYNEKHIVLDRCSSVFVYRS